MRSVWALLALSALPAPAQFDKIGEALGQLGKVAPVTDIAMKADPADGKVRPLESVLIQVRAYGKDGEQRVRLRRGGPRVRTLESGAGWISKPFVFQGKEDEKFFDESKSVGWNIYRTATGEFVNKDCVLYTAPEAPGKYKIEAELEGKKAEFEIQVTPNASSRRKSEKHNFPASGTRNDPYRPLAERYAPFLAQETWFQPKADIPVRFDYDGDWQGDNNWDSLEEGSSQAYVYYAVMETETHWHLIYNLFHPRDYSDRCVIGTCHENDNEGIILTILKDGSQFGRLQVMQTLAHDAVYPATNDPSIHGGVHSIYGGIELYQQTHPAIFIESGGHGIYGTRMSYSRYSLERDKFTEGTGITLISKGVAERPRHPNDRLVGYELLPIYDEWWLKAEEGKWKERTFDEYFQYQPFGGRPGVNARIGGAFYGQKESPNKAKPFWGWHDKTTLNKRLLAVGQWGLDPAYGVSQTVRFPSEAPVSLNYTFNPYLGVGTTPQQIASPAPAPIAETAAPDRGQVDLEVQVDSAVEIVLAWDQVAWETVSGQPPSKQSAKFSSPLPNTPVRSWNLTKLAGRGNATLVQKPSPENRHRAKIRVEDSKGGSDLYRLRLTWTR